MYRSLMDSVGEREGGKIWENGIETCKILCMKRVASPGLMHRYWMLGAGALGRPRGMEWGGMLGVLAHSFRYNGHLN